MNRSNGFTLIELVVVIVILGILSATALPKFINISEDAEETVFLATGTAFKTGVDQVHIAWLVRGNGQAVQDFISISDPLAGGDLSVNSAGYPADTRGVSLTLNSLNDCLDVWRAVLDASNADVQSNDTSDIQAEYNGSNKCTYTYNRNTSLTVVYDSANGEVIINN